MADLANAQGGQRGHDDDAEQKHLGHVERERRLKGGVVRVLEEGGEGGVSLVRVCGGFWAAHLEG